MTCMFSDHLYVPDRRYLMKYTEPTVQQEETPQPPPAKRGAGIDGELFSVPGPQLKADMTFFNSLEEHFGHSALFSGGYRL